jgi:hypothetical protein
LNKGLDHPPKFEELQRANDLSIDLERDFHEFEREFRPWMDRIWKLEVIFLILGTLQWGYGDQFVVYTYLVTDVLQQNGFDGIIELLSQPI